MSTQEWTRLVQQVDRLILALKQARAEATRWRARAVELEGRHLDTDRNSRLEEQAKERELERLRRERKKIIATVEKMIQDIDQVQNQVAQGEEIG
jgi:hypothetical protein